MTPAECAEYLRQYNAWRRGGDGSRSDFVLLGKTLDASIAHLEAMGWRSIETAPKDGTRVDLWMAGPRNNGARRPDCWFSNGNWWCDCLDRGSLGPEFYIDDIPTHWMPLPAAPKGKS